MDTFKTLTPAGMERDSFLAAFGGIYEHSRWIAEQVWDGGLDGSHNTVAGLHAAMQEQIDIAGHEPQLALLRAHPDLAGKLAVSGQLTRESTGEQASAGLDQCSADEFAAFQLLNDRYKQKFGFPFILAVKGRSRAEILDNFRLRVDLDPVDEFAEALSQVHQIALLRLNDL
ncbi:MAG: 2-oxo-4-hydroxy-4-carboxy-5-ureidoimidazoline decarboxylase [Rhodospirillales bacterium]|nr:2-oxo-4-hydroxy-4-carboxy-5-ureidoimidazoline decarboxylase [Rhodospirillales bacterium]